MSSLRTPKCWDNGRFIYNSKKAWRFLSNFWQPIVLVYDQISLCKNRSTNRKKIIPIYILNICNFKYMYKLMVITNTFWRWNFHRVYLSQIVTFLNLKLEFNWENTHLAILRELMQGASRLVARIFFPS